MLHLRDSSTLLTFCIFPSWYFRMLCTAAVVARYVSVKLSSRIIVVVRQSAYCLCSGISFYPKKNDAKKRKRERQQQKKLLFIHAESAFNQRWRSNRWIFVTMYVLSVCRAAFVHDEWSRWLAINIPVLQLQRVFSLKCLRKQRGRETRKKTE